MKWWKTLRVFAPPWAWSACRAKTSYRADAIYSASSSEWRSQAAAQAKKWDHYLVTMGNKNRHRVNVSGAKKEPKPKLLSSDIFWWGGGLPREGVGAKKFGMSLETQGIKLFGRDIPGFCRDIPEAPEKFEKKGFGFNSRPLMLGVHFWKPFWGTYSWPEWPISRDAGSDAMWVTMRVNHGNGDAMRYKNPGDARSRCGNPLRCAPTMRNH